MPKLVCQACGRQLYTVAPLEARFGEGQRCPRCGAPLALDRRSLDRRQRLRRVNPPDDPGPPPGIGERRLGDRRVGPRRRGDHDRLRR